MRRGRYGPRFFTVVELCGRDTSVESLERFTPKKIDEIYGQDHLLGPGRPLRNMISSGRMHSCIIYGPPGTGKTSLLKIIKSRIVGEVYHISASTTPVTTLKKIVQRAKELARYGKKTLLLLDEIHNVKRNDQRIFLEPLEKNYIVLVATTTESPSHYVIDPLLSRMRVFYFKKLSEEALVKVLKRALRILGKELDEESLHAIASLSDGDARKALISLINVIEGGEAEKKDVFTKKEHYNLISAFIKSVRGSDPDAAIYYLARMLELGEDPRFIARRLVILASEDIGLADRMALPIAVAAAQAVEMVGLPEAEINLAHATLYLALAPKSNSAYMALKRAKEAASKPSEVPKHLKNLPDSGYKYPHDYGGWVEQRYLPENVEGPFYVSSSQDIKSWLQERKK